MHPLLVDFGVWRVTSYGLALTLGFAFGIGLAVVRARRRGWPVEPVLGVSIVIVVSSMAGSRGFMLLMSPESARPSEPGLYGLSVMGGLPLALVCTYAYLRLRRLPALAYMDLLAPSVAFGAGFARIGCLLNGCCHGVVCTLPWAIRFPEGSLPHAALGDVAVHPTQPYQSLLGFALGFALLGLARSRPAQGAVVSALMLGMGAQRLVVGLFRHHSATENWIADESGLTLSGYQGVAIALMLAGAVSWGVAARRSRAG